MRFELKAIGSSGEVEALDFQASDQTSAVRSIEGRGYTVLSVRARRGLRLPWQRGAERLPVALFSQGQRGPVAPRARPGGALSGGAARLARPRAPAGGSDRDARAKGAAQRLPRDPRASRRGA